jgi:hypothetical protein
VENETTAEKVIFVLLPHTVQYETLDKFEDKKLPAGMLAAQAAHVVSLMRTDPIMLRDFGRQPITTVTLSVRNSKELEKVWVELSSAAVDTWVFRDENPRFYGTGIRIITALCTEPIERAKVASAIGHLELYKEIHTW